MTANVKVGDEFDEADFSESHSGLAGNPDEVIIEPSVSSDHLKNRQRPGRETQTPSIPRQGPQAIQQQRPPAIRGQSIPAPANLQNSALPPQVNQNGRPTVQSSNNPQNPTNTRTSSHIPPQSPMAAPHGNINGAQRPQQAPAPTAQNVPNQQHIRQGQPLVPNTSHPTANALQPKPAAQPAPQSPARQIQLPPSAQNDQKETQQQAPPVAPLTHEPPVGFFTARAAESLQNPNAVPPDVPVFNPRLESPSIRKTVGVDHTKSKPVNRELVGAPQPPAPLANSTTPNAPPANRTNFVNPQVDASRKIGMPGAAASPLQNRNSYKPPQMKRPAESNGVS